MFAPHASDGRRPPMERAVCAPARSREAAYLKAGGRPMGLTPGLKLVAAGERPFGDQLSYACWDLPAGEADARKVAGRDGVRELVERARAVSLRDLALHAAAHVVVRDRRRILEAAVRGHRAAGGSAGRVRRRQRLRDRSRRAGALVTAAAAAGDDENDGYGQQERPRHASSFSNLAGSSKGPITARLRPRPPITSRATRWTSSAVILSISAMICSGSGVRLSSTSRRRPNMISPCEVSSCRTKRPFAKLFAFASSSVGTASSAIVRSSFATVETASSIRLMSTPAWA